jgi:hypothetical protein
MIMKSFRHQIDDVRRGVGMVTHSLLSKPHSRYSRRQCRPLVCETSHSRFERLDRDNPNIETMCALMRGDDWSDFYPSLTYTINSSESECKPPIDRGESISCSCP